MLGRGRQRVRERDSGRRRATSAPALRFNKDWTSQVDSYSRFTTKVKRAAIGFDGNVRRLELGLGRLLPVRRNRSRAVRERQPPPHRLQHGDGCGDGRRRADIVCRVTRDGYAGRSKLAARTRPGGYANRRSAHRRPAACRSTRSATARSSQAAHDYAFGFLDENLNYKQQVVALNVTPAICSTASFGAGPIAAAHRCARYRTEKARTSPLRAFRTTSAPTTSCSTASPSPATWTSPKATAS